MFVGNGWLALVPSHLPLLRLLCLENCHNVLDKDVEELVAAVPVLWYVSRDKENGYLGIESILCSNLVLIQK